MGSRAIIDQLFEEALPKGVRVSYQYGEHTPMYYMDCPKCDRPFGRFTDLRQLPYNPMCKHCRHKNVELIKKYFRTGNVAHLKPPKTKKQKVNRTV